MSVIIKGIKAWDDCRNCPYMTYSSLSGKTWCTASGEVLATDFRPIPFDGKSENCPVTKLPENHGRLFDTDEFIKDVKKHLETYWTSPNEGYIAKDLLEELIQQNTVVDKE